MKNGRRPLDDPIRQMLSLHEEGLTYRQIGERLGISHETVRTHVRRYTDTVPFSLPTDEDGSCWMTTAEAAEALGVKQGAVQARIQCGKIEAQRVGPRWFVRIYDSQRVDSNGVPPHIKRMAELRAQGLTYAAIGEVVGLDGDTVLKHLKRRGLDARPSSPTVPSRVQRMADLRAQGLSYEVIGAEVGLSDTAVQWQLKRWGLHVPVRKRN
jgi:excisionase family DNA binding protein